VAGLPLREAYANRFTWKYHKVKILSWPKKNNLLTLEKIEGVAALRAVE
jgi:hypothetical protein